MIRRAALGLAAAAFALTACDTAQLAPRQTATPPEARPVAARVAPAEPAITGPSAASRALSAYYRRVQDDLVTRGLLRTDGGGRDAAFTDTMLVRNFARIALEEEYARGQGLRPSRGDASAIKKWRQPVRIAIEFGPSVPRDQTVRDRNAVIAYARRLSGITGHPISVGGAANFHVLFMGEDDRALIRPRVRELVPDVGERSLAIFDDLPRAIHCLVIAFAEERGGYEYGQAIALIRAEHPDLLRLSCIHEEMAQGLGLANDSPNARPSIFNDDDEFALLTDHDALLLQLLYDPALRPGMTADEALPIVRARAARLVDETG